MLKDSTWRGGRGALRPQLRGHEKATVPAQGRGHHGNMEQQVRVIQWAEQNVLGRKVGVETGGREQGRQTVDRLA